MAGPFVTEAATEEVKVPCVCEGAHENDTLTVKTRFSGSELSEMDSAMFVVGGEESAHMDMGAGNRKMMEIAVQGWSFTDASGAPIPFDRELVNQIDARAWLVAVAHLDNMLEKIRKPSDPTGGDEKPPRRQRSGRS